MGSAPLLTVVEAKNGDFFPSTAVMKGSDPIKSTASSVRDRDYEFGRFSPKSPLTLRVIIKSTVMLSAATKTGEQTS